MNGDPEGMDLSDEDEAILDEVWDEMRALRQGVAPPAEKPGLPSLAELPPIGLQARSIPDDHLIRGVEAPVQAA